MNAQEIGRYKVGDDELVLRVPNDEVPRVKLTAALGAMETAETSEMGLRYFAVVLSVLTGRSIEECYTMVPLGTVALMWEDITRWLEHLRPVRPC